MKSKRHRKILELIKENDIATQEELADFLRQEGFNVTQATVSRDIKELALVKVSAGGDQYKYAMPPEVSVSESRLRFMLKEFVINYDYSENIMIIHTAPGNANAVASALDTAKWDNIIGSVAGDDTILLVIKPKEAVNKIIEKLEWYLG